MNVTDENLTEIPMQDEMEGNLVLFRPHVPAGAVEQVRHSLGTRWIGQGPKVNTFERRFLREVCGGESGIAVGSGTDALHLAYLLAEIEHDDEVITPVFTCTATNIPLLYLGARVKFADVDPDTMNIDVDHMRSIATERTKAIVVVHYGGLPCDLREVHALATELGVPVIEDAAHAVGASYGGAPIGSISDFTMFSFQAVKHITTGDGGFLSFRDGELLERARRLRWFGIDRSAKQLGIWENDIREVGYKYQMTDIGAAMGLAALDELDQTLALRRRLFAKYAELLSGTSDVQMVGAQPLEDRVNAAWLVTVLVDRRRDLQRKLLEHGIESNQVHYRNDRYSVFGGRRSDLPNMDSVEDRYLVLPLHTAMSEADVERVCSVISSGW